MQRDVPLQNQGVYHIYNRGTNKMRIFEDSHDYERFCKLLYICNQAKSVRLAELSKSEKKMREVFSLPRGDRLVTVLAYSIMPNHFHMLVRQEVDEGIARYMQKVGTAYSMYFNMRHKRTGTLFQGKFKSKCVDTSWYLRHVFSYILINPIEIKFPKWKSNKKYDNKSLFEYLDSYPYSSYVDFFRKERIQSTIIDKKIAQVLFEDITKPKQLIQYYEDRNDT